MAKQLAAAQGRWEQLRADLIELYSQANVATDGALVFEQEYLLVTARKPARRGAAHVATPGSNDGAATR